MLYALLAQPFHPPDTFLWEQLGDKWNHNLDILGEMLKLAQVTLPCSITPPQQVQSRSGGEGKSIQCLSYARNTHKPQQFKETMRADDSVE